MAEYIVDSKDLNAVANAIREKAESDEQLTFPSEFVSAIGGISTGTSATEPYIEETYNSLGRLTNVVLHGYTKIRDHMFDSCMYLYLTSLPNEITSIGEQAFRNCYSLALTSLPSNVTSISSGAFGGCTSLALTSLPSGITSINYAVFTKCESLALTSLPSGVTNIGAYAFSNCFGLTSVTFEGTPTSINSSAFANCTNLTDIKVPWAEGAVANAPWGATNATITYNYTGG